MEKLYYIDPEIKEFTATVTGCSKTEKGWEVTLDTTAFYPTGGGQACDLGTLGNANVLDVAEREEEVIHLCNAPLEVGAAVTGKIDWARRFDLMQQHTGEHIVSGIIHKLYGHQNSGFHVGEELLEVDFDGPLPEVALEEIQRLANEAVWADIPVNCHVPSPEELPGVVYRTKRALPWPVRIVEIPGIDCCACCGIHTKRTAQVGLVYIFSCVKFHQGVRLEMACGKRALERLHKLCLQNKQVSQILSARPLKTGAAAQQMKDALAVEKYRAAGLESKVFENIAATYAGQKAAFCFEENLEPAGVRQLAEKIAKGAELSGVFSQKDGKYNLCLAGNPEEVKALGTVLSQTLGARGGGKPGFWQGSVTATQEQIQALLPKNG